MRIPLVRLADGRERLIDYEEFTIADGSGKSLATRRQIPLKLAWYMV